MRLASVYSAHGRLTEAIQTVRRAIDNQPQKAVLHEKLGLLLAHTENWQAAKEAYTKASELTGGGSTATRIGLAQVRWMLGDKEEAEQTLDSVSNADARRQAWSELADWLAKADRWEEHRYAKNKSGGGDATPRSFDQKYRELVVAGDYQGAAKIAQQALSTSNDAQSKVDWSVELATLDFRQGRQQEAIQTLTQLRDQHTDSPRVWSGWGDINRWMNRADEAIDAYEKAIELGDQESYTLNNLGALLSPTDPKRAEEYLRRAVEADSGNYQAWHSLGNTLVRQNRIEDAAECYRRAISIQPDFAPARQTLQRIRRQITRTQPP